MPTNTKRDPLGSLNVFYKPTTSKKFKGVPFDRILKISEKKSHSAEKIQRGYPLVYPLFLETLKNLCFSARLEPYVFFLKV